MSNIDLPDSCDDDEAAIQIVNSITAIAFDVDESGGRVAWIEPNGAVYEWTIDGINRLIAPIDDGPLATDLMRVYNRGDYLMFAAPSRLWRYYFSDQHWESVTLNFASNNSEVMNVNVESGRDRDLVTARTSDGTIYMGTVTADDVMVEMNRIYQRPNETFGATGTELVDVQRRGSSLRNWTFVLEDRVQYYDADQRTWTKTPTIDSSSPLSFQENLDRGVIISDQGNSWWVANRNGDHPETFSQFFRESTDQAVSLDADGVIWRLLPDAQIQQCVPSGEAYACSQFHPAAMLLNENKLRHAFLWQGIVLFETVDGLRAYEMATSKEILLDPQLAAFDNIIATHHIDNQLLFYNGASIIILDSQIRHRLWSDIDDMVIDVLGRPWANFSGQWRRFVDGEWHLLSDFATAGQDLRLFVLSSFNVSAVDSDRYGYFWNGTQFIKDDLALPGDLPTLELLIRGRNLDWWALSGRQLFHVERTLCAGGQVGVNPISTPVTSPNVTPTATPIIATPVLTATFTPVPTAAQVLPASATPVPTPTPMAPCLRISGSATIPFSTPVFAQNLVGKQIELRDAGGRAALVSGNVDGQYDVQTTIGNEPRPDLNVADNWIALRSNLVTLAIGQTVYDPVESLQIDQVGRLIARWKGGNQRILAERSTLAESLEDPFVLPEPLDVGWLQWNREEHAFALRTATGTELLSPGQFIVDNQLIFEQISAILARETDELYAATRFGVWAFDDTDLKMDDGDIIFYPPTQGVASITDAAHNRFVAGNQVVLVEETTLNQTDLNDLALLLGDVSFIERLSAGRVEVVIQQGQQTIPGHSDEGFLWDSGREGIAYEGDNLYLQSDAGIHRADNLVEFDAGPSDGALVTGHIQSDGQRNLYLATGEDWYLREKGTWRPGVSDPVINRTLLQTPYWKWALQNNKLEVDLDGNSFGFRVIEEANRLGFSSDQVRAAGAVGSNLFVVSEAFTEIAGNSNELGNLSAIRQDPRQVDRFESYRINGVAQSLLYYDKGSIYQWDDAQQLFVAASDSQDPEQQRILMDTGRLRVTWNRNQVNKELWLDSAEGPGSWLPFEFVDGQFPFDVVTSLATFDDLLYVGTVAGLALYSDPGSTSLSQMTSLIDLRKVPTSSPEPVHHVGVPANSPKLLVALSQNGCVEQRIGQLPTYCEPSGQLQEKLKVRNDFWRWTRSESGHVTGHYVTNDGALTSEAIYLLDGRWQHDTIADATVCQGHLYTLWDGGWLSDHGDPEMAIDDKAANYPMRAIAPRQLICLPRDVAMSSRTLSKGIYFESLNGQVYVLDEGDWQELINDSEVADLKDFGDSPPIYYGGRLRLLDRSNNQPFTFDQRSLDGRWHPISWMATGQMAIDHWNEIAMADGHLWAATPTGLVAFSRDRSSGDAVIDPESLIVVREPSPGTVPCQVTDLRLVDDIMQARCSNNSDHVYQGSLSTDHDRNVFSRLSDEDPFAERILISEEETGYWSFSLSGRAGGDPGFLEATLNNEEIGLDAGRFQFDTISSIAMIREGLVDLATTNGGWYEAPLQEEIRVSAFERPTLDVDPKTVNWIGLSGLKDEQMLCLQTNDEAHLLNNDGLIQKSLEVCAEFQAAESFWLFEKVDHVLSITAPESIGGLGRRQLISGRFSDDIAVGLPVTTEFREEKLFLLPTFAGVVGLDEDFTDIILHPFDEEREEKIPTTLYAPDASTVAYFADGELLVLDDTRAPLEGALLSSADTAGARAIEEGPDNFIRVRWKRGDRYGWSLLSTEGEYSLDNALLADVGDLPMYSDHRVAWGLPTAQLLVAIRGEQMFVQFGNQEPFSFDMPDSFTPINPILVDDRIIFVGQEDLYEINLESAMATAMQKP